MTDHKVKVSFWIPYSNYKNHNKLIESLKKKGAIDIETDDPWDE